MQPIWKGHISFGLVSVPVSVYSATVERSIPFTLLHGKDNSPIRYKRFCEEEDSEVPKDEIVKGYEFEKGQYVVLTEEDLSQADAKLTKTIDIVNFVKRGELDPMWFDKPYYLEPQKGGEKPYALLRQALEDTGFGGVAKTVLRNREHLGVVLPHENLLVLQLLRFSDEVRGAQKLEVPEDVTVEKKQLELATELINKMAEEFNHTDYVDEYSAKVLEVVRKKAAGKRVAVPKGRKAPAVKDLMDALRKSLKAA